MRSGNLKRVTANLIPTTGLAVWHHATCARRFKSWARNRLDLQLRELLKTAIVREETISGLLTSGLGPKAAVR